MNDRISVALCAALALALGCGGGHKGGDTPSESEADDSGGTDTGSGDTLVPEEKFDEINAVFDHKASIVSRCYVDGVEAGELDKAAKGHITVGATIGTDGHASGVEILQSSLKSKAAESCVVDLVASWTFTDSLPKPVQVSHTYVMDRF